nr:putative ribonuclease H-like domain-containing protein [Tanacetum cinerariifolium]
MGWGVTVIAASITITADDVLIHAATTAAAPKLTAAPSRRTNGVVIRDPEESTITTSTIIHSEAKSKDKGKGILAKEDKSVKRYQAMKRKPQTEAQARKNMMVYLKNVVGFKMDYFKGMTYDDIRPVFEKHFDLNVAFLQKTKEQIKEEESRALKRINETPAEKAAKRRKLNKEVEELKRHLQIVPDEDDDVYTEATPLARKVPVVDYEIYNLNNKPYFKIIRADGTHKLYKNQRSVHGQAKVKSWKLLESSVHLNPCGNIIESNTNMVEYAITELVKFISAHQTISVHFIFIDNALDIRHIRRISDVLDPSDKFLSRGLLRSWGYGFPSRLCQSKRSLVALKTSSKWLSMDAPFEEHVDLDSLCVGTLDDSASFPDLLLFDPWGNHKQYAQLTLSNPQRHVVPAAVLTQSKLVPINDVPINAIRPVSTVIPKLKVTRPTQYKPIITKPNSPIIRHINHSPSPKASNSPPRVTAVKAPMINAAKGMQGKWEWKPKCLVLDHIFRNTIASVTLKRFDYNDALGRSKTGKLDFDDVYFVKELKVNLFSVSQMCDKKNSVPFIDTECLVLSPDFKLPDESQVLLTKLVF